jgi:hypothetical protein
VARKGSSTRQPLPPPLPPAQRTVGQLVAESINFYRHRFWPSLLLGLAPAAAGVTIAEMPNALKLPVALTFGSAAASSSYAIASAIVAKQRLEVRRLLPAVSAGIAVLVPAVFLLAFLNIFGLLPAVIWLGLFGFVVPVAVIERRLSWRRAYRLARVDLIHAVGSLATLAIVGLLTGYVIFFTLRSAGTAALQGAAFLSVLVIAPLLFLGAALLYYDQAARVPTRRSDADLHHALEPDRPGRPDAEGQP